MPKHLSRTIAKKTHSVGLGEFFKPSEQKEIVNSSPVSSTNIQLSPSSSVQPLEQHAKNVPLGKVKTFVINEEVSRAEILWCLQTVLAHKSMRTAAKDINLLKTMFPDSVIASKVQLQRSKIAYSLLFGIAPYFKKELLESVSHCEHIVVGFDESLNKVSQEIQMDLNIRFWDNDSDEVCTRFLNSAFMCRTKADNLRMSFKEAVSPLHLKKIL